GIVTVAGHSPRALNDSQRHRLLGYVPQTAHLFSGTVADNLAYGDPGIGRADMINAASIAGVHAYIDALPDGYDTRVGGGATAKLSAGQVQLLGLARALVPRPEVLLLDEATALIDPASDAAIRTALREHVQPSGTAIVTIAHRLATARDADRVIVLDDGGI